MSLEQKLYQKEQAAASLARVRVDDRAPSLVGAATAEAFRQLASEQAYRGNPQVFSVVWLPGASVVDGRARGCVVVVDPQCSASALLGDAEDLCAGRSVYRLAATRESSAFAALSQPEKERRFLAALQKAAVVDSSLHHLQEVADRRAHLGGLVLGRRDSSVSLHHSVVDDDTHTSVWTLVVNSYYTPSSEALAREIRDRPTSSVEAIFKSTAYAEAFRFGEASRDAIAYALSTELGFSVPQGACYTTGLPPAVAASAASGPNAYTKVTCMRASECNEYNVLRQVSFEGRQAYAYYDHCLYAKTPSVAVGLGRGLGYDWFNYDNAAQRATEVVGRPDLFYAYPLGVPKALASSPLPVPEHQVEVGKVSWGNRAVFRYHPKACKKRYLDLSQKSGWRKLLEDSSPKEDPQVLRLRTQVCYVSSPREHGLTMDALIHYAPSDVVHLPLGHPALGYLYMAYAAARLYSPEMRLKDLVVNEDEHHTTLKISTVRELMVRGVSQLTSLSP